MAFAADSLEEALAEFRLALAQGDDSPDVYARAAHTYVELGQIDDAADYYREAIALDPSLADQAVADLLRVARRASRDGDRFQMASAASQALAIEPSIGLGDMALPLARHFFRNGEYGRALPLYNRALATSSDTLPRVVFEIGQAHEEIGDCQRALVFFEQFREDASRAERSEVDWYIGNCSFQEARRLRSEAVSAGTGGGTAGERLAEALAAVERAIEVGEPRNIQGQAWFERGEILAGMGECDAALESFAQVRYTEPGGAGPLVTRAQDRIDELRFGRGLEAFRSGGGCG